MKNFYVLVDPQNKIILDKVQELPENWRNIAGLPGLSDEELRDLKWAGWDNLGWINIRSPEMFDYKSSPENLEMNKLTFKTLVTEKVNEKKESLLAYKQVQIPTDVETRLELLILKERAAQNPEKTFIIKLRFKYYEFSAEDVINISNIIEDHNESCNLWESKVYYQIESCKSLADFSNINYDF
jgi:hypothetical protein